MKKKMLQKAVAVAAAAVMVMGLAACSSSGSSSGSSSSSSGSTYTVSYTVMDADANYSPIENSQWIDDYSFYRDAYYESYGGFVDQITVDATLAVDGDVYTLTWETHCGSEDNEIGTYEPTFVFTGTVTDSSDTSVSVSAPTEATLTVHSSGQFATNAETVGYFGPDGYEVSSAETDDTYERVPSGELLLTFLNAGTYTVSGSSLGDFTAE